MEFIANDDDDFNKLTESVEDGGALEFEDWDEEPPGFDDEPVPEPDFNFYDLCNLRHRCQVPMRLGMERKSGTYMHRVWPSKGYVLFHDPESDGDKARQFMAFIDTLPIPCSNAELISFDLSERSRKRSAWRAVLQISANRKIKKMLPQNSHSGAPKSWLAIRPEFRFDSQILSLGPGQAGFRFAFTMGFLRYGHL